METGRIVQVTYGEITNSNLRLVIQFDSDEFVVDYPVLVRYENGDETVLFDNPERIPEDIRNAVLSIMRYNRDYETTMAIREAESHGHPDWSHMYAYGPCTKDSAYQGGNLSKNERLFYSMDGYTRSFP